jgi:hypothetical protein
MFGILFKNFYRESFEPNFINNPVLLYFSFKESVKNLLISFSFLFTSKKSSGRNDMYKSICYTPTTPRYSKSLSFNLNGSIDLQTEFIYSIILFRVNAPFLHVKYNTGVNYTSSLIFNLNKDLSEFKSEILHLKSPLKRSAVELFRLLVIFGDVISFISFPISLGNVKPILYSSFLYIY